MAILDLGTAATADDVALSATLAVTRGLVAHTADDVALSATLNTDLVRFVGWAADESQKTFLEIILSDATLQVTPAAVLGTGADLLPPVGALALPPTTLTERVIQRYSVTVPAMTPTSGRVRVSDAVYDAYSTVIEDVGVPHLLVSGHDVTYFRGTPTTLNMDRQENPFGDSRFSFDLPQLTPFEGSGEGSLAWLYPGAEVEVVMVLAGVMTRLWAGHLISDDGGNDATTPRTTWSAEGTMYQASWFSHRVPTIMDPTDIGKAIAGSLNGVVSRRYSKLYAPTTTILTRDRGTTADSELSYVQRLLSTSWTAAGLQWTISKVAPWAALYALVLKNRTTVNHTVTVGGRGVEVDLSRDLTATSNCIFGRGIGPDGYGWAGWVYPNLTADTAPAYPYSSGATVMNVGSTDAGTVSGSGVTDWQRRINDLNLTGNVPLDGVYNTSDAAVCRVIQRDYGLTVDGVVGPQTWAATFAVGSGSGDLSGAYRRPLAIDPKVEPYLYSASGAITGPNPAYDATVIRIERDIDYGPGVTKAEATASAVLELARDKDPCLTGRIVLTEGGDPREGSRFLMKPGENVKALGYGGHDVIVQAAAVERDWVNLKVTLEVDEHARDAMTLASIRDRNKAARVDPARRPGPVNRRSRLTQDVVVDFDGESSAGVIPRMALYSGLWSVIHIPISQVGRIASVKVNTTGPKATFCLALFGAPVTPAHLVSLVGNPLVGADPFARTETKADALDNLGFIEAYGNESKPAGYWPATTTTTITGRLVETAPTEYVSEKPPWVWVAIWSPTSCFIEGRLRPAPIQ